MQNTKACIVELGRSTSPEMIEKSSPKSSGKGIVKNVLIFFTMFRKHAHTEVDLWSFLLDPILIV